MPRLIVKHFGPIKEIDIEIRDYNVFIGPAGTGKSTVAKLLGLFHTPGAFSQLDGLAAIEAQFQEVGLRGYFREKETEIEYHGHEGKFRISAGEPRIDAQQLDIAEARQALYIPAERAFLSIVGASIMGLLSNNVALPAVLKRFGSLFEVARQLSPDASLPVLEADYQYVNGRNRIKQGRREFDLEDASSGFQSAVPLLLVLMKNLKEHSSLIIEEPELHLYPSAQKALVDFIAERSLATSSGFTLSTHSPYILTALDNLIQAHNAFRAHPEQRAEIAKIVPENQWLDFDRVSAYYFSQGKCTSIVNHANRSIGANAIDDVSQDIAEAFEALINIEYP